MTLMGVNDSGTDIIYIYIFFTYKILVDSGLLWIFLAFV